MVRFNHALRKVLNTKFYAGGGFGFVAYQKKVGMWHKWRWLILINEIGSIQRSNSEKLFRKAVSEKLIPRSWFRRIEFNKFFIRNMPCRFILQKNWELVEGYNLWNRISVLYYRSRKFSTGKFCMRNLFTTIWLTTTNKSFLFDCYR